ncbi:Pre-mRNA splicing factor [Mycena sanguinolenta]|uniref:Pre-mRNA splicing factor n=1 Tax=Mycena sanguinolenta TaxID=230812 RepID=A0A8H6XL87_9AGAR|nr:Pre-mRNA splicing factor [Mycena sanguinolenta]
MDSDQEDDGRLAYATFLVKKIFDEVCEEFRLWKKNYASRVLRELAHPPSSEEDAFSEPEASDQKMPEQAEIPTPPAPTLQYMEIQDLKTGTTQQIPTQVFRIFDAFPVPPPYEYCTPTDRNIFLGDDPSYMPFLPFRDDPTFDQARYANEYKGYSWEKPFIDPDLEVVVIEAARRLHGEHQMLYQHIDETGMLPLELLDRDDMRGMIYRSRRRDFPEWPPGVSAAEKILQYDTNPVANSPDKALALLVSTFCTNLNCTVGFCGTHLDPTPMPLSTPPLLKSEQLKNLARTPCSADCILLKSASTIDEAVQWSANDLRFLRTLLDGAPDTSPCDLATICFKPCYEVFAQRQVIIPDTAIKKPKPKPKGKGLGLSKSKPKLTRDQSLYDGELIFTPGKPCRHDGPCDATTQCACFLNKAHCESSCRCSRKCERPPLARLCMLGDKARRHLPYATLGMYVVLPIWPALTDACPSSSDAQANVCQNADIQRVRWKRTKVAPGRWGLGLFMAEAAAIDDLIIEYVGELIFEATTDSREPISEHRGRNYLFELNPTLSIDGTYAANDARYINHDGERPNCCAKVRMVNGEHRIGIYATRPLKPGEEVLFNYGKFFFQSGSQDE